jgi:hypothetical protein
VSLGVLTESDRAIGRWFLGSMVREIVPGLESSRPSLATKVNESEPL